MTGWTEALPAPNHATCPVFIGGCSRSGTTLLAAMLGSGPGAITVPEAEFKWNAVKRRGADTRMRLGSLFDFLERDPKFAYWGLTLPLLSPAERAAPADLADVLARLAAAYASADGKPAATRWVDHTPGNIRYLATLAGLYPDAKLVHIVRDGRAVAASVIPLDFGPNTVAEAADYWASQAALGLAATKHFDDGRVMMVRFEDLLEHPRETLRAVCEHVGIRYNDAMVHERDYRVQAYTAEQHSLVARPPDPRRATAWRAALTRRDVEIFEARTGELLAYLGYAMDYGMAARDLGKTEHLQSATTSAVRRLVTDRVRRHLRRRRPTATHTPAAARADRTAA